ncbi:MAG: Ig-like domain-containing protein, partial [Schleiferiaceae bacterium]|nr:Ig-like domain-containing protein [Schleiferiaceae bacterium]
MKRNFKLKNTLILALMVLVMSAFGQDKLFPTGSIIIDMGANGGTPTVDNSLKPYGLVYEILEDYNVPVSWIINTSKTKDAADFTYDGFDYKAGPFIISGDFVTPAIAAACSTWAANYGFVVTTSTTPFTAPEFRELVAPPLWGVNADNSTITLGYLGEAGIPNGTGTKNTIVKSSDLTECFDQFMVAHSDPTYESHGSVYRYVQPVAEGGYGGWLWVGCHGVSEMENIEGHYPTKYASYVSSTGWDSDASKIGSYIDREGTSRSSGTNEMFVQFSSPLSAGDTAFFYVKNSNAADQTIDVQSIAGSVPGGTVDRLQTITVNAEHNSFSFNAQTGGSTGDLFLYIVPAGADVNGLRIVSNSDDISIDAVGYDPDWVKFNFLSSDRMVKDANHGNGTPSDYTTRYPTHPFMQFIGTSHNAHAQGSEQIYVPTTSWRPGSYPAVTQLNHPDEPSNISDDIYKQAAPVLFGRAYDDPDWGFILYQGGHDHDGGSVEEQVAAKRMYLNFSFLASVDNPLVVDQNTANVPDEIASGTPTQISATASNTTSYSWASSCGGSFSDANISNPIFTPPVVAVGAEPIECVITLTLMDDCGREFVNTWKITIYNDTKANPVALPDAGTFTHDQTRMTINYIDNDYDPNLDDVSAEFPNGLSGTNGVFVDNGDGTVSFIPTIPLTTGPYTEILTYRICKATDNSYCSANTTITFNIIANTCPAGQREVSVTTVTTVGGTGATGGDWLNPSNANGVNDGTEAELDKDDKAIDVYFNGATLPDGTVITIYARGTHADAELKIKSKGGTAPDNELKNKIGITGGIINFTYTISGGDATHLEIKGKKKNNLFLDAIEWDTEVTTTSCEELPDAADAIYATGVGVPFTVDFDDLVSHPLGAAAIDWSSFSIVSSPTLGTLGTLNASTHELVYTPNANIKGDDTFEYEICDGDPDCDQGTITIKILEAAAAIDDINYTKYGTDVSGNVLTNDYDPNSFGFVLSSVQGTPMVPAGIT